MSESNIDFTTTIRNDLAESLNNFIGYEIKESTINDIKLTLTDRLNEFQFNDINNVKVEPYLKTKSLLFRITYNILRFVRLNKYFFKDSYHNMINIDAKFTRISQADRIVVNTTIEK